MRPSHSKIDPKKLSVPKNAIVGKLAMKKNMILFEVDKGFKSIWDTAKDMDSTLLCENLYLFTFKNDRTMDRVLEYQPWNFRGSLVILNRIHGDECPTKLAMHTVPFWV